MSNPPAITCTGLFYGPIESAKTLLANTPAFQTWVGASTATQAKAHIARFYDPMNMTRPCVLVYSAPGAKLSAVSQGQGINYALTPSKSIRVRFEAEPSQTYLQDPENAFAEFVNNVDNIITGSSGCQSLSGTDGYLVVREFDELEGPQMYSLKEGEPVAYFAWELGFEIGV